MKNGCEQGEQQEWNSQQGAAGHPAGWAHLGRAHGWLVLRPEAAGLDKADLTGCSKDFSPHPSEKQLGGVVVPGKAVLAAVGWLDGSGERALRGDTLEMTAVSAANLHGLLPG